MFLLRDNVNHFCHKNFYNNIQEYRSSFERAESHIFVSQSNKLGEISTSTAKKLKKNVQEYKSKSVGIQEKSIDFRLTLIRRKKSGR